MNKKQIRKSLITIGILIIIIIAFKQPLAEAMHEMHSIHIWQVILISLMAIVFQICDGLNYAAMTQTKTANLSKIEGISCAFYTTFFKVITFGSGSVAGTIYYMNKRGIKASRSTSISALSYMFHKLNVAILAILFLVLQFSDFRSIYDQYFYAFLISLAIAILIAVVFLTICISKCLHTFIIKSISRFNKEGKLSKIITTVSDYFAGLEESSFDLLKDRSCISSIMIRDIIKLLAIYSIPYIILSPIQTITGIQLIGITAVSCAVASVLPAPAGIGSTEVAFLLFFANLTTKKKILSCALLYRFMTFLFPGILGGVIIGFNKIRRLFKSA
jgi:glycosyltransferase 2 family protein